MPEPAEALTARSPLAAGAAALRRGDPPLDAYITGACDRIDRVEERIRALLPEQGRRERLLAEAAALLARHPDPAARPPLFGVLVGVKDIIAVDGMPTRAGSAFPPEFFAMREATVVARLRAAGALILGKTVTTEFAYASPGATANPHDPARTPGGSSSGSAAAVAAGYALLALGTQTVGSVIRPAAFCGVVGFKPSYGRIPTDGVLYYAPSVDHVGLFTQDAAGMRLAASVLLDGWREPTRSARVPVLGVPDGPYLEQTQPAALDAFEAALERLAARGVEVRRVPAFNDIAAITARHRALSTAEFGEQHAERFARYGGLYRGASAGLFDAARRITPAERAEGLASREALRARLLAAMTEHWIDLWACPAATGPAPVGLTWTGDPAMNLPWTHAGVPALTLPAGVVDEMPVGLQLAGRFGADEALLAAAEALEPLL